MIKLRFTILISIFVIASGAKAEIYKWVDEEGNTYFSDESSEQYKNEELQIEPGPSEEEVFKAQQRAEQSLKDSNELEDELLKITPDAVDEPEQNQPRTLKELDYRCEKAIEEKLAPLREAGIKECISNENLRLPNPHEDCDRLYKDYGAGTFVNGRSRPRMFHDLPECIEAAEAVKTRKGNGQR
jgi:hypothetical protein